MMRIVWILIVLATLLLPCTLTRADELAAGFRQPPDDAKPWVFWFWINGNISKEGITKDLEAMKRVGINGVLWMEVAGSHWAPKGPIEGGTPQWHDAMQWAISEADRLGMDFALSVDFGYGSGGPHITPDRSMQKLLWTQTEVRGGQPTTVTLKKPIVGTKPERPQMRADDPLNPKVTRALNQVDSYRDVAVFAFPSSKAQASEIDHLEIYDGRGWKTHLPRLADNRKPAPLAREQVIDLTHRMNDDGRLLWDAPRGTWTVVRLGHATNLKLTRPCPISMVGLECDRLHRRGIETHFEHHLKPILDAAGDKAGLTLKYIHIDSWEAHGQNWTTDFAEEFRKRRGYASDPWVAVLTGQVVESADKTDRFLWDMRQTVSELMLSNYIDRLRELLAPYGVKFSCESYGHLCVDQLTYGGRSDFPICEYWTERATLPFDAGNPPNAFPTFSRYWYSSMKGLASVANTSGKPRVGELREPAARFGRAAAQSPHRRHARVDAQLHERARRGVDRDISCDPQAGRVYPRRPVLGRDQVRIPARVQLRPDRARRKLPLMAHLLDRHDDVPLDLLHATAGRSRDPCTPLFLMAEEAPIAHHDRGVRGERERHLVRAAAAHDERDAAGRQRARGLRQAFEHERVVPCVRVRVIVHQTESGHHRQGELVGPVHRARERRVVLGALRLLHPVQHVPTGARRQVCQRAHARRLGHSPPPPPETRYVETTNE